MKFQQKDKFLIEIVKVKPKDSSIKQFYEADKMYSLLCRHRKIVILKQSRRMVP